MQKRQPLDSNDTFSTAPSKTEGSAGDPIDLTEVRRRLDRVRGAEMWRSLEELAESSEFEELLKREFPRQASELHEGVNRRRFLQLMSASLALGGMTACTRQPLEKIVPYVDQPESIIPGKPMYFASAMVLDGVARPVMVESHMGRPTKIEGNPDHPASAGATDLLTQASLLTLYDPERSQVVRNNGRIRTWEAFLGEMQSALDAMRALGGAKLRILTRPVTSPTEAALLERVLQVEPAAKWHQYAPVNRDSEMLGIETAFGQPLSPVYDFTQADVIVSLDTDFLTQGPGSVCYSKDFASRRRVTESGRPITRYYSAESYPTSSGTLADHRLPLQASEIETVVAALAAELGLPGSGSKPIHLNASTVAWLEAAAVDLSSNRGRSVLVVGESTSWECQAVVHAINDWLGNTGSTVIYRDPLEARPENCAESLEQLVSDMAAGEVDVLLILGGNPVYETPADLGFQEAFLNVERRIHVGLYEDETAELSHWHLPEAHCLESWRDARAFDGRVCFTQPLIEPLYDGKTHSEVLSLFAGTPGSSLDLLQDHWRATVGPEGFNARWRKWLHDGFSTEFDSPIVRPTLQTEPVAEASRALETRELEPPGLDLIFRPDPTVYDGSFSNNGWLQECPKPLTKLTWDNAAMISPALAQREGLETTQLVELTVEDRSLEIPVWVLPGHPDNSVTIHLGYGRRKTGRIGTGTGFDAYRLRSQTSPWLLMGASMRKTEGEYPLASTQMHSNIELEGPEAEKRHLVRVGTLEDFEHDPEFVHHVGHGIQTDLSIYPDWEFEGHAWGLTVDLSACTGCNACVVACQAENNIPIVGKEMVAKGREMHWIRIDRYFQGDLDQPRVHNQPVMCMHCEQAPCEPVCPVGATVHSDEGLNDMVYNRCVGTRYCSNNCPYKVRRFNFLKYNDTETSVVKMMRNPDVTVRVRGVMEKCTYCVQRINEARITARTEDRDIRDGEIKTACQQVCPSEAILFGDTNDTASEVSRSKANPLNYGILEELGTRPRTSYLAKMRNPNNKLETG